MFHCESGTSTGTFADLTLPWAVNIKPASVRKAECMCITSMRIECRPLCLYFTSDVVLATRIGLLHFELSYFELYTVVASYLHTRNRACPYCAGSDE